MLNPSSLANMSKYTFKIITVIAIFIKYVVKKINIHWPREHESGTPMEESVQNSDSLQRPETRYHQGARHFPVYLET